jgi:hypothetical protein
MTERKALSFLYGWGGGTRTPECQDQNLVPYHLATPHSEPPPPQIPVSDYYINVRKTLSVLQMSCHLI